MSFDLILAILGVVVGLAYFAVRNNRKQQEMKRQARRMG
jgi:hypothetical protein